MSIINSHVCHVGFVAEVEAARAHDLLVHEGGLAWRASAAGVFVVHLVQAETLTGNIDYKLVKKLR